MDECTAALAIDRLVDRARHWRNASPTQRRRSRHDRFGPSPRYPACSARRARRSRRGHAPWTGRCWYPSSSGGCLAGGLPSLPDAFLRLQQTNFRPGRCFMTSFSPRFVGRSHNLAGPSLCSGRPQPSARDSTIALAIYSAYHSMVLMFRWRRQKIACLNCSGRSKPAKRFALRGTVSS
jgi:hypothetical protein